MLLPALSTPGNVTTVVIAAVALLLGVLLMARGRRDVGGSTATVGSPSPGAPAAAVAQPDQAAAPATAEHAVADPAAAEPAAAEPEPAGGGVDEAPFRPKRIRLGGSRFGQIADSSGAAEVEAQPPVAEPTQDAPAETLAQGGRAEAPVEGPAQPQRIRLGGARFASASPDSLPQPTAVTEPEPSAPEPYTAPESAGTLEPSATPAGQSDAAPAAMPEEAPAAGHRLRLGGARFPSATPEPHATPVEPEQAPPAETDPATSAEPDPASPEPPALPSASEFRQGTIRLRG